MYTVGVSEFVLRQCNPEFIGTKVPRNIMGELRTFVEASTRTREGYASFCKIVVLGNNWGIKSSYALVTEDNEHLIECKYVTRRDGELPYLSRWFSKLDAPVANYLHAILYTREQLVKENEPTTGSDFDIVAINAEMGTKAAPMTPDTMIRNHMGHAFGGSGEPLNAETYRESAAFWSRHATIK